MSTTDQAHSSVADIDQLCINTIRTLSIDAVQAGKVRSSREPRWHWLRSSTRSGTRS